MPAGSPFAPREALAGKEARTLAREVLAMDAGAHRAAFRGSPMKRAKLPMLRRNAAVVLGDVGTAADLTVLEHARTHGEALVREHAGWALEQVADRLHASVSRSSPLSRNADTLTAARR